MSIVQGRADRRHEWVFILKGSAVLVEVDATLPELSFDLSVEGGLKRSSSGSTNLKPTERKLGVGDFIGWQGGVMAAKHAHSVRAGDQGCEYLMGGSRTNVDCCVFPLSVLCFRPRRHADSESGMAKRSYQTMTMEERRASL